jgi:hypothetical protein
MTLARIDYAKADRDLLAISPRGAKPPSRKKRR